MGYYDISGLDFNFDDAQKSIDRINNMIPTISGYIGSIYNYQDFLDNIINRIKDATISSNIYYYDPMLTPSGFIINTISSYVHYKPPKIPSSFKFTINQDVLIKGTLECTSLYTYIDTQDYILYNYIISLSGKINNSNNNINLKTLPNYNDIFTLSGRIQNLPNYYNDIITLSGKIQNLPNYDNDIITLSGRISNIKSGSIININLDNIPNYNDIFTLSGRISNINSGGSININLDNIPNYNDIFTLSGRISNINMNLNNIPKYNDIFTLSGRIQSNYNVSNARFQVLTANVATNTNNVATLTTTISNYSNSFSTKQLIITGKGVFCNTNYTNQYIHLCGTTPHSFNDYVSKQPGIYRGLVVGWNRITGGGRTDFVSLGESGLGGFDFYSTNSGTYSDRLVPLATLDINGLYLQGLVQTNRVDTNQISGYGINVAFTSNGKTTGNNTFCYITVPEFYKSNISFNVPISIENTIPGNAIASQLIEFKVNSISVVVKKNDVDYQTIPVTPSNFYFGIFRGSVGPNSRPRLVELYMGNFTFNFTPPYEGLINIYKFGVNASITTSYYGVNKYYINSDVTSYSINPGSSFTKGAGYPVVTYKSLNYTTTPYLIKNSVGTVEMNDLYVNSLSYNTRIITASTNLFNPLARFILVSPSSNNIIINLPDPPFPDGINFTLKVDVSLISNQSITLRSNYTNFYGASNVNISYLTFTTGYGTIFSHNNNWYLLDSFFKNGLNRTLNPYLPQILAPEYVLAPQGYYDVSNNEFIYYDISGDPPYILTYPVNNIVYPDTLYENTFHNNIYLDSEYNKNTLIDLAFNDKLRTINSCMIKKNNMHSLDIYGYSQNNSPRLINLYDNVCISGTLTCKSLYNYIDSKANYNNLYLKSLSGQVLYQKLLLDNHDKAILYLQSDVKRIDPIIIGMAKTLTINNLICTNINSRGSIQSSLTISANIFYGNVYSNNVNTDSLNATTCKAASFAFPSGVSNFVNPFKFVCGIIAVTDIKASSVTTFFGQSWGYTFSGTPFIFLTGIGSTSISYCTLSVTGRNATTQTFSIQVYNPTASIIPTANIQYMAIGNV